MAIDTLDPSPAPGEYTHSTVRLKINETVVAVNALELDVDGLASDVSALSLSNINNRVVVKSAADLSGALDSAKLYVIDGIIDFSGTGISITVPAGGFTYEGLGASISMLKCSDDSYDMFVSPAGGCGNIEGGNCAIETSGTGSSVYAVTGATGGEAFEHNRVVWSNCSSMGYVDGFRQGLELNTVRFFGQPSLELRGVWSGGYRQSTSLIRFIDSAMTAPIFKAGAGLTFGSRFLTDVNADLSTAAALFDFSDSNFTNTSSLLVSGASISRNGVSDASDQTISPNIDQNSVKSLWKRNTGIADTHTGGRVVITTEVANPIAAQSVFEDILGTFTSSGLVHFTNPSGSQMLHNGSDPRDYNVFAFLVVDGAQGAEVAIKAVKWNSSLASFEDVGTQTRQINSLVGGRDVAFFDALFPVTLDKDDYLKLQIANNTDATSLTAENGSGVYLDER
jgi:hypothetical protein